MSGKLGRNAKKYPPAWLQEGRDISHTSESNRQHYERSIVYYKKLLLAMPEWLTDEHHKQMRKVYKECARRRANGENVVVDHIVPVCGETVSGLMVPWNLQIITAKENNWKSNWWWPDGVMDIRTGKQTDLFECFYSQQFLMGF